MTTAPARRGVSLTELLVALAIVGILSLAVTGFLKKRRSRTGPASLLTASCPRPSFQKLPPALAPHADTLRRFGAPDGSGPSAEERRRALQAVAEALGIPSGPPNEGEPSHASWHPIAMELRDWDKSRFGATLEPSGSLLILGGALAALYETTPVGVDKSYLILKNDGTLARIESGERTAAGHWGAYYWPCGTGDGDRLVLLVPWKIPAGAPARTLASPGDTAVDAYVDGEKWAASVRMVACKTELGGGARLRETEGSHCLDGWLEAPTKERYPISFATVRDLFENKHAVTTLAGMPLVRLREAPTRLRF